MAVPMHQHTTIQLIQYVKLCSNNEIITVLNNQPNMRTQTNFKKLAKAAIEMGNKEIISTLLEHGLKLHTALDIVINSGKHDFIKLMLEQGADVDEGLCFAVKAKKQDVITLLLEQGANINANHGSGYTPLQIALMQNMQECDYDLIEFLITEGADTQILTINNKTSFELFQELIEYDNDPTRLEQIKNINTLLSRNEYIILENIIKYVNNCADDQVKKEFENQSYIKTQKNMENLARAAVKVDSQDIMIFLLECGLNVSAALDIVVNSGKDDLIKLMLDRGADINECIYFAVKANKKDVVTLLLSQDVNNKIQKTMVIKAAIEVGNEDIIVTLIGCGIDVNTVLKFIISSGKDYLMLLTINQGADIDEGLYYAVKANNKNAIILLLTQGANINTDKNNGYTPLHIALMQKICDVELVELLIKSGADTRVPTRANKTAKDLFQKFLNGKYNVDTKKKLENIANLLSDNQSKIIHKSIMGLPNILIGFSYKIKVFTLYAVMNTKQFISCGFQYELSTEVKGLFPFDDIYLRKTKDGHTSCEFVQITQGKIDPLKLFDMPKTVNNMKQYIKGSDSIVNMFIKCDEINDSALYQNTSKNFIYCTNSNFKTYPLSYLKYVTNTKFGFLCGLKYDKWVLDSNFVFVEIRYIILNLLIVSPYFEMLDEKFKVELNDQVITQDNLIRNKMLNHNDNDNIFWPIKTIAIVGLSAVQKYLTYLRNCKKEIENAVDIKSGQTNLPAEFEVLFTDELDLLKKRAVSKINEMSNSYKIDKNLFSYFSKFNDVIMKDKIDSFVEHFSIYTDCPTSDELEEYIIKEINEEFQLKVPIHVSEYCLEYFSRWISYFKNEIGSVFTHRDGRKLFDNMRLQMYNALNQQYTEILQKTEYPSQGINLLNKERDRYITVKGVLEKIKVLEDCDEKVFNCIKSCPNALIKYSDRIKYLILYAIINNKLAISSTTIDTFQFELSTEVKNLVPFDNIHLRKTQNEHTSCEFIRINEDKIYPLKLFAIFKTDNNREYVDVKQYISADDSIVKIFIKYTEIKDNPLYKHTSNKLIFCTFSNFETDPSPHFKRIDIASDEFLCGLKREQWITNTKFVFEEIKYILLNLLGMAPYNQMLDDHYKTELTGQIKMQSELISDLNVNKNSVEKDLWSLKTIADMGFNAITKYSTYLDNCKIEIEIASDTESVKKNLPADLELLFTDDLVLLIKGAIETIDEVSKSLKIDEDLFIYFSRFDDDVIREKIDNFVEHFNIYTNCPRSDELDEIIVEKINKEFKFEVPILISAHYLQYFSRWISNFKNEKCSVFTDTDGRKLFHDIRIHMLNGFKKFYVKLQKSELPYTENNSAIIDFLNNMKLDELEKNKVLVAYDEKKLDCLKDGPNSLRGLHYQIKFLTLYAIINTKLDTSNTCQFELCTEVRSLVPFDDIYLKKTQDGQTSCEFIQVKQGDSDPLKFFIKFKTEQKRIKKYVKRNDTIIKMFIKFNEIYDDPLYGNTSKKFIYCTSSYFQTDPDPFLKNIPTENYEFLCGLMHNQWIIEANFIFVEMKCVLLNLLGESPYVERWSDESKTNLNKQIIILENFILNQTFNEHIHDNTLWSFKTIAIEGQRAIKEYLNDLRNRKRNIENAKNIENVKNFLPTEFKLFYNRPESLAFLKKEAVSKLNGVYKSFKIDTDLFEYFSKFEDDVIKEKINNFVKHFSIYTECPNSDELDEIITKEIREEIKFDIPILISAHCRQYFNRWISNFKYEQGRVFTDRGGRRLFYDISTQIMKAFNKFHNEQSLQI